MEKLDEKELLGSNNYQGRMLELGDGQNWMIRHMPLGHRIEETLVWVDRFSIGS